MIDLRAAGSAVLHAGSIYAAQPSGPGLVFTYPPVAAILFGVVALIPNAAAQLGITALSVAALLLVTVVAARLAVPEWPRRRCWLLALTTCALAPLFEPVGGLTSAWPGW
jgi:alpha-1,2-mannosyltransferase